MSRTQIMRISLVFAVLGGIVAGVVWHERITGFLISLRCCRFFEKSHTKRSYQSSGIKHLACIMDGNRRWAKERGLPPEMGHEKGVEPIRSLAEYCGQTGIKYLTLYTFSLENLKRSEKEKKAIWKLFPKVFGKWSKELIKNEVKIKFVGDRSLFPQEALATIEDIEKSTEGFAKLQINFMFCYGGRQEIVAAAKNIVKKVKNGLLKEENIDELTFGNELWTGDMPPPDLIIRTGKHSRLSNYLLYQAAYSELAFLDCYWPDITPEIVDECICSKFKGEQRNFGV
ncbi:di-trans,poly-cis-decaprenylcistransferase [Candidatus Babeliales bacterium]|nr:di-trans,poly-cis-decaprenylcistransferase [Candidatus Babeliales bacterium]